MKKLLLQFLVPLMMLITGCSKSKDDVPVEGIVIGTQQWMKKNLDVVTYRNGDIIPQVTDPIAWGNLTTGAWCYYNNDSLNGAIYGKLYNWHAVSDPRGLAPKGWHIPTDAEWSILIDKLGGVAVAGGKMKSTGTTLWTSPNTGATNESGFTGLPGGENGHTGIFSNVRNAGYWWSSSEDGATTAWYRGLYYFDRFDHKSYTKRGGLSIRCIKD